MKSLIVVLSLNIVVLILGIGFRYWEFSKNEYISKEVLEMMPPFDVTIDIEFLTKLKPAYEQ